MLMPSFFVQVSAFAGYGPMPPQAFHNKTFIAQGCPCLRLRPAASPEGANTRLCSINHSPLEGESARSSRAGGGRDGRSASRGGAASLPDKEREPMRHGFQQEPSGTRPRLVIPAKAGIQLWSPRPSIFPPLRGSRQIKGVACRFSGGGREGRSASRGGGA